MSDGKELKRNSNFSILKKIADGLRFQKLENIPDHYWEIIEQCWEPIPQYS